MEALAPHEKVFPSPVGTFTIGNRDEAINRIAPLNMMGTTREALVSNVAYARIDGGATGTMTVGYHIGCAVNLQNGVIGITPNVYPEIPSLETGFRSYVAPVFTATMGPGQVADVKLSEKQIVPGDTAMVITRDFHVVVNGCTGPVTLRQYTNLLVKSPLVDDSGSVFGDPTWL
ncbi:MspA family porin [Nocardia uniformis]|uniref:MspA family porin n=1 Tax=Nocardia uniformis TaxID=53432 RepID=A0A849C032_9NOCA|nr:MspA family porin [Nocardia uniformis]